MPLIDPVHFAWPQTYVGTYAVSNLPALDLCFLST